MTVDTELNISQSTEKTEEDTATAGPVDADASTVDETEVAEASGATGSGRRVSWSRVVAFGILPTLVLLLALGAGYAKWRGATVRDAQLAGIAATQTAKDGTVALLAYRPDTVENDLTAARNRLTGAFRDSYTSLTDQVVIPGAQQKLVTAVATVPAAALVSTTDTHAVVLVFVDQTTTIGNGAPSDSASSVRVTLDKVDDKWLISGFDPV